ncbi:MAG: hypothetical protein CMN55_06275 [Sneathiella sp.]|jgi:hypothetical protein|uniref:hypothetical protein n=1 Tax=Sneathiella sp. TaxID=1964365 RepID=UPI000C46DA64|nr:hypothetical protein [Sneathiella sp.]MAL78709.1 hypothetical protein [Sneathiella sp.]|tara:strand:- start:394 stop:600 length:207 start_codon:yes stop_codon:yes gene_type:complete
MTARTARNGRNQGGKNRKKGGGGNGNGLTKNSRSSQQRAARKLTLRAQGRHSARRQLKKVQAATQQAA